MAIGPVVFAGVSPRPRFGSEYNEVSYENQPKSLEAGPAVINEHNWQHPSKPKIVSNKTMHERAHFLFHFFGELRRNDERNYKVDPRNLGSRHVRFMVNRWIKRDLVPGTIQLYLSYLRVFSEWIGKPGLVLPAERYVSDPALVRRSYAAQDDKSWSAKALNTDEIIERVANCDPFVGAQLHMCSAYAARVKEAIMCRPYLAEIDGALRLIEEWNCDSYLEINRGTKGERMHIVPIDSEEKRAALGRAKHIALHETPSLGHPGLSLKQSINRFYNTLKRCGVTAATLGVTAHGLRHEYANDRYEQAAGQPSPIRAGQATDRALDRKARLSVAKELGHARENITTAYLGAIVTKVPCNDRRTADRKS